MAVGNPEVPLRFSVLAGEIIHHLRSSLDHLIYALIIQNGETPTNQSQFPFCTTLASFEKARRDRIKGVSTSAASLVESVQPFTSPTPDDTVLYAINHYDNIDKHRLLVMSATLGRANDIITIGVNPEVAVLPERQGKMPNIVGIGPPNLVKLSEDGAVIFTVQLAEPAPEFVAETDLVLEIAFEKFCLATNVQVIKVLSGLLAGARHTINLFQNEF